MRITDEEDCRVRPVRLVFAVVAVLGVVLVGAACGTEDPTTDSSAATQTDTTADPFDEVPKERAPEEPPAAEPALIEVPDVIDLDGEA